MPFADICTGFMISIPASINICSKGSIAPQVCMKIFVDLLSDERLNRRIIRNLEAGETLDVVTSTYLDIVRYRHHEFVEPTRWYADLVINGAAASGIGIDAVAAYVERQISL